MLELLIGNIASGKSTWCKKRAKSGALILNDDSLFMSLHGGLYDWPMMNGLQFKGNTVLLATQALLSGREVVIDSTNHTKALRGFWIALARYLGVPVAGVLFKKEKPEIHAGRRFEADNRGEGFDYWLEAARRKEREWEEPSDSEGFDNLVPIEIAEEMESDDFWQTLPKAA